MTRSVRVVTFVAFLVALLSAGQPARAQDAGASSTERWRADLRFLAEQMPLRHKSLYHTMTPGAFKAAVAQLDADIPHLNDDEITMRIMTIATMPGDSHTGGVGLPPGECFPMRLRHYDDGLYVESASPAYANAVGGRVLEIGDQPAETLYDRLRSVVPHDSGNPGLLDFIAPVLLTMGHVLHGLDVTPTSEAATFVVLKDGKHLDLHLTPAVATSALFGHAPIPGWVDARGNAAPPLWLAHPEKTFWSTYIPATKLFYIQFNAVKDDPDKTVAQFFGETLEAARALPIDKLVLDLRMNDGGNNYLLKPIIVGLIRLPAVDQPGHLFVVTSRNTYSAAQNLVNRLELYTDATFVGQPTGEHINSYGDPVPIVLPNSRIRVGMSSVWWQDTDERDKRIETDPEIAADPTFADYRANRDPALDEIIRYQPEESLEDLVAEAAAAGGSVAALHAYRAFEMNPIHRYVRAGMEQRINRVGYNLLGIRRTLDAIAVLQANAQANPNSANAADSLGEAFADAGNRAGAIASYRRALQLKPTLASSRAALKALGVPAP